MSDNPYSHLDVEAGDIRLLMVKSGSFTDGIECILGQRPLATLKSYYWEALSYTWGDTEKVSSVLLNGTPFPVTRNLEIALRNLRFKQEPEGQLYRVLWIDAVCINQDDVEERNLQVSRMGAIYQAVGRVMVWLGERRRAIWQWTS
jgi:hypothetical protein